MKRRTLVLGTAAAAITAFGAGALWLRPASKPMVVDAGGSAPSANVTSSASAGSALVRLDAPRLGPDDAPVTVVKFFDPACEACRAFHPVVVEILAKYPEQVRVVMRYASFHDGSAEALSILEAARRQDLFEPVLLALYETQPVWASHGSPSMDVAWKAAEEAGLELNKARSDAKSAEVLAYLEREKADIETVGVRQTPTFFINGSPLMQFGKDSLLEMVRLQVEANT